LFLITWGGCSKACFSGFERHVGAKKRQIAEAKHLSLSVFPGAPLPFRIQISFALPFNPPLRARRPQARYPFSFPGPLRLAPGPTSNRMHDAWCKISRLRPCCGSVSPSIPLAAHHVSCIAFSHCAPACSRRCQLLFKFNVLRVPESTLQLIAAQAERTAIQRVIGWSETRSCGWKSSGIAYDLARATVHIFC